MYELLLMTHFLSLGAGLGISLTFFVLGRHTARLPPAWVASMQAVNGHTE